MPWSIPLVLDLMFHQDLKQGDSKGLAANIAEPLDVGAAKEAIHLRR